MPEQRMTGGTAFALKPNDWTYIYWETIDLMMIVCDPCYRKQNPIIAATPTLLPTPGPSEKN